MDDYGYHWIAIGACGQLWIPLDRHWWLWKPMHTNGVLFVIVDVCGY